MKNPLDGVTKVWNENKKSAMYEYFVKGPTPSVPRRLHWEDGEAFPFTKITYLYPLLVVPTIYEDRHGNKINTNQFSVTEYVQGVEEHSLSNRGVPGPLHGHF